MTMHTDPIIAKISAALQSGRWMTDAEITAKTGIVRKQLLATTHRMFLSGQIEHDVVSGDEACHIYRAKPDAGKKARKKPRAKRYTTTVPNEDWWVAEMPGAGKRASRPAPPRRGIQPQEVAANERRNQIMTMIKARPRTIKDISVALGLAKSTTGKYLCELQRAGLLEKTGEPFKPAIWTATK